MGLERMLVVLNQVPSSYETDVFLPLAKKIEDLSNALRNHKFQNICLLTYPNDTNSKIIEKYLITDYRLVTTKTFPQSNSVNCFVEASLLLLNHSIPGRNRTAIGGLGNLYSIR